MASLIVAEGANRGVVLSLEADEIVLGRDPECAVTILDDEVSRRHARLVRASGGWTIEDLGSRNGIRVNGLRCATRTLVDGDEIRLGGTRLVFLVGAAGASAAVAGGAALTKTRSVVDVAPEAVPREVHRRGPTAPILSSDPDAEAFFVGESAALRDLEARIGQVAGSDAAVLITGETGVGKERMARALHANGDRRGAPFVPVHCAAFTGSLLESELFGHERGAFTGAVARRLGFFELATEGTLFLDEVGEIPPDAQAKLLRVIERKEFYRVGGTRQLSTGARFLFATHRDLAAMVREGRFRQDLLYRLQVVTLHVPPLRDRPEDIEPLLDHFLDRFSVETGRPRKRFASAARRALRLHPWPGNVRELRNLVERCYLVGAGETVESLEGLMGVPAAGAQEPGQVGDHAPVTLEEGERDLILRAIAASEGNRTRAAVSLGIDRKTLWAKMRRHGLRS